MEDKKDKPMFQNVGKLLQKFSVKEQMEMTLIAVSGMLILTAIMAVYMVFFMDFTLFFRIIVGINSLFGILFLFSMLASSYAQYKSFLIVQDVQGSMDLLNSLNSLTEDMKGGDNENG